MKFVSTDSSKQTRRVSFREALVEPIPGLGHLWMPEILEPIEWPAKGAPLKAFIDATMKYFAPECWDSAFLNEFAFEPVLVERRFRNRSVMELQLYHGETESFKDVGCFVAAKMYNRLFDRAVHRVIVATSGDTGGAVAAAFAKDNGIPVTVLYPKGKISPYQEKQIVNLEDPYHRVLPIAVSGDFDRCQKIAKQVLMRFPKQVLSSNSISLARLLPQIGYHAWVARQTSKPCVLVIPSGNMGNCVAALMCKRMGATIARVHIACNENNAVARYINHETLEFSPKPTVVTPASAMDVGKASNFVRLAHLGAKEDAAVSAGFTTSSNISIVRNEIGVCPHTACGYDNLIHIPYAEPCVVVVATASPRKFISRSSPRTPIDRAIFNRPHKLHVSAFKTVFLVGPPNTGKSTLAKHFNGQSWKTKTPLEIQSIIEENNVPHGVVALCPYIIDFFKIIESIRRVPSSCILYLNASAQNINIRQGDKPWDDNMVEWFSRYQNESRSNTTAVDSLYYLLRAKNRKYMSCSDIMISTNYTPIKKCIQTIAELVV